MVDLTDLTYTGGAIDAGMTGDVKTINALMGASAKTITDLADALATLHGDALTLATSDPASTDGGLPVRQVAGGYSVSASITRTADTNAYLANDVIGAATGSTAAKQFAAMGPASRPVMITCAELEIDASALISGEASYTLHLYNVTPPSALGDNTAFDLPSGDRASYLGSISLGTPVDLGSTLYVQQTGINKQVKLGATPDIYGYLVTAGAYTPTSARVYKVTLHTVAL